MNRKISPLTKAKEAIVIDTTDLDIKEQIKKIISIVNNK
jgi:cytidylate kinase